jgi:hypothetical protein
MRIAAMETLEIHEGAVVDVGWDPAQVHVIRERW